MIIGRKAEIQRFDKVFLSKEAEFVVIYGRRRVGKTFLVRQFFQEKNCIFFQSNGLQKGTRKKQLLHFAESLSEAFTKGIAIKPPVSWDEAFRTLSQFIEAKQSTRNRSKEKIVIFLDELPWMATKRSGLLEALDYYWNRHWSSNPNIIVVVCGSSASWLIKNIIYNKGGLHNRCTCEVKLDPFNLSETKAYLKSRGINLKKNHVLDLYMVLGGIPYYLKYVEVGLTAAENIQHILFDKKAPLKDEFKKLFSSLFSEAEVYIELVKLIAKKKQGLSRSELEATSTLSSGGGRLTERLTHLIQTNFIESYVPWNRERGEFYKLIDEFSLFYIYWLLPITKKGYSPDYWLKQIGKPVYHVWAGYAFEAVCHKHIVQVLAALNIKTAENISAWRLTSHEKDEDGAQVDLLIDRSDDAINLCEIKHTVEPFVIDKFYAQKLKNKIDVFVKTTKTTKQIFLTMISANGVKRTIYLEDMVTGVVTLEDLF